MAQRRRANADPDLIVDAVGSVHTGMNGVLEAVTADGAHHLVTAVSLSSAYSPASRFCRDLSRCTTVPVPPDYAWARIGQRAAVASPPARERVDLAEAAVEDAMASRPGPRSGRRHEMVHVAHRGLLDALELLLGPGGDTHANNEDPAVRVTVQGVTGTEGYRDSVSARVRLSALGRSLPAGDARVVGARQDSRPIAADVRVSGCALRQALAGGTAHVLHFRDDGQLRVEALSARPRSTTIAAIGIAAGEVPEHRTPLKDTTERPDIGAVAAHDGMTRE
jgi:hypothetical protein